MQSFSFLSLLFLFFFISFGPAHPAAHGVFRILLELEDEAIIFSDSCLGLLHRVTEKVLESKVLELSTGFLQDGLCFSCYIRI